MPEGGAGDAERVGRAAAQPKLSLSADERLAFYLAPLADEPGQRFPITPDTALLANPQKPFEFSLRRSSNYVANKSFHRNPASKARLKERYFDPLIEAHHRLGINRRFQLVIGDDLRPSTSPTFHKARRVDSGGCSILLPLNDERHFKPVDDVGANDIPFDEKASRVVWRGSTTGVFWAEPYGSRYFIYRDWDAIARNEALDLGFSGIVQLQQVGFTPRHGEIERCKKPRLTQKEQLEAKYLLVLEGNDLASGLKWILASNSVVLMPRCRNESWACESYLVPGVHYVEVAYDLSDLGEVFAWCEANPAACREIAENGKRFMQAFRDPDVERSLFDRVVREYHRRVRWFDPDKAAPVPQ
ncbi:hypothetical protein DLJ53_23410 [Acuticoccus sediminis]|uniref:Glycosyl transferase CAP10 domain-containing protein n=2 Tax=Acuticoccus sediminis TaxID=2184697 RepID=A0A8B2NT80_9HYPH|nr:hypothetical protein DLJ53_23410 [Acuticoccus sediminis]